MSANLMTEYHAAEAADNIIAILLEHQKFPLVDMFSKPQESAKSIAEFRKQLIADLLTQPASFKLVSKS